MTDHTAPSSDVDEIRNLISRMFDAVSWSPERPPDWDAFGARLWPSAIMIPSTRPARLWDAPSFIKMMQTQRDGGELVDFEETALGTQVLVFGNIAVALGGYASSVNRGAEKRGANAFLLIRGESGWEIAALAWDNETAQSKLPAELA